jgi:hypothetical protein
MLPDDVLAALEVTSASDVILREVAGRFLAETNRGELPVRLETARRLRERGARWAGAALEDPLIA